MSRPLSQKPTAAPVTRPARFDVSIDSRADDHEQAEQDPGFTGFHRIEYGLWAKNSTEGLEPVADKLLADVKELAARIESLTFPPEVVVGGAAALMEAIRRATDAETVIDVPHRERADEIGQLARTIRQLSEIRATLVTRETEADIAKGHQESRSLELARIADFIARKRDSSLTREAMLEIEQACAPLYHDVREHQGTARRATDLAGNGRFIRNIIEAAEEEREFRLSTAGDFDSLSQDDLMRIETTDVRAAISGVLSGLMR